MKIAAEVELNEFRGGELTRIGLEVGSTFDKVAQPLAHSDRELRARVFIEVEEV